MSAAASAATRAGGGLVRLWLPSDDPAFRMDRDTSIPPDAVLSVVTAAGGTLRELHGAVASAFSATQWTPPQLRRLAAAAPALALAELDVRVDNASDAAELFVTGFGVNNNKRALRLRTLHVSPCAHDAPAAARWSVQTLRALCAGAAAADVASLRFFSMGRLFEDTPDALPALCAAAAGLRGLGFLRCGLDGDSWRHLAAALAPGTESGARMAELSLLGDPVLDASPLQIAPFTAALRASALTALHLEHSTGGRRWYDAPRELSGLPLLEAAVGHATLRSLHLRNCAAIGDERHSALGPLLAAAAASLHDLDVSNSELSDEAVQPLVAALTQPSCTLRRLALVGRGMSAGFVRGALTEAAARVPLAIALVFPEEPQHERRKRLRAAARAAAGLAP